MDFPYCDARIIFFREKLNYFWVLVIIVTLDFELMFFEGEKRGKKMGKRGGKKGEKWKKEGKFRKNRPY